MALREFNASLIPTVQNAAYAAGQSLGGLLMVNIGDLENGEGLLTQIQLESVGGSTVGVVAYVWSAKPANSTITDKANFVPSQADNKALIIPPTLLTPSVIVSAQDTHTYASASNLMGNFAQSAADRGTLYVALLANASVTPATAADYRLNLQGIKDCYK